MSAASLGTTLSNLAGSSSSNTASRTSNGFAHLSSDEFIKVLISELSNQDPLKPQDSGALMEQMSSLRNIESQLLLQKSLESLVAQNSVASASGLLGKMVAGIDDANNEVSGLVTGIRIKDGQAILELDTGHALKADRVTEIAELTA